MSPETVENAKNTPENNTWKQGVLTSWPKHPEISAESSFFSVRKGAADFSLIFRQFPLSPSQVPNRSPSWVSMLVPSEKGLLRSFLFAELEF